jgi:hypothetical protein
MSEVDVELMSALDLASEEIDKLTDLELLALLETAESIRRQLLSKNIDASRLALVMLQLGIESEKVKVDDFDVAFA